MSILGWKWGKFYTLVYDNFIKTQLSFQTHIHYTNNLFNLDGDILTNHNVIINKLGYFSHYTSIDNWGKIRDHAIKLDRIHAWVGVAFKLVQIGIFNLRSFGWKSIFSMDDLQMYNNYSCSTHFDEFCKFWMTSICFNSTNVPNAKVISLV